MPGRSGTHTVRAAESGTMLRAQCRQEPLPPCSSTSGGIGGNSAPQRRQTIVPNGVVTRDDVADCSSRPRKLRRVCHLPVNTG